MKRCLGCMQLYEEGSVCPHCGYIEGTEVEEAIHMSPGTILRNRYTVGKVLGFGGFGVTYIGYDSVLDTRVAIKEYLPSEFSTRVPGQSQVLVFDGDKSEQFRDGMKKFVEEARHLAKFQNEPGIVRIFDAFEDNDTAYIVMEYLEGETLTAYMEKNGPIDEDKAVEMLTPIMESLKVVHAEGMLHRDIAPDNIFLTSDGEVRLIDFGASRYATTSHSRSLTVIIKPGFSPEEQYRSRSDQGPHTDVYALGATLYKMITGITPPDAMERRATYEQKSKDILVEPHKLNKNISAVREVALLNALNVRIEDRTPDVETFMEELNADKPAKRIYGKIRRVNLYRLPTWIKISLPAVVGIALIFIILMLTGVIDFSRFSQNLVIPDGVVSVPEVEGMTKDDALAAIGDAKLLAVTDGNVESKYIKAGTIVFQSPNGSTYMNVNGEVRLTVSSGGAIEEAEDGISTVPYVIWDNLEDAIEKFKKAGLAEPEIEEQYDDSVAEGQVISQSVEAGEKVEEGTVLKLVVSLGPKSFEMPDVAGMDEKEAEELLVAKGISVTISYKQDDSVPEGQVIEQDPEKGTEMKRGDSVTLTVASKVETIKVRDVTGMKRKDAEKALKDQGFKVTVLENFDDKVPKGEVISQNPVKDTELKEGDNVTIYVSKGTEDEDNPATEPASEAESSTAAPTEPTTTTAAPTTTTTAPPTTTTAPPTTTTVPPTTTTVAPTTTTAAPTTAAPKYLTIYFDGNGGTPSAGSIKVAVGSIYGPLPSASRPGYNFLGWTLYRDGGDYIDANSKATQEGSMTVYADWFPIGYTVSFDPNGGYLNGEGSRTVYYGSPIGDIASPGRNGYSFVGWFTDPNAGSQVSGATPYSWTNNITLYAHWIPLEVTISFDLAGGTLDGNPFPGTIVVNYEVEIMLSTPEKEGATFLYWYFFADAFDYRVYPGQSVRLNQYSYTPSITFYAAWEESPGYDPGYGIHGGNRTNGQYLPASSRFLRGNRLPAGVNKKEEGDY